MKNLKKLLIVTFAFLTLLTLSGCSAKQAKSKLTAEEAFAKTKEVSEGAKNYKMGMKMSFGLKADVSGIKMDMDVDVNLDSKIDVDNEVGYLKMDSTLSQQNQNQEMYIKYDKENNKLTTYILNDGKWYKQVTNDDFSKYENSSNDTLDILTKSNSIKQIDADKENYNYEITITKADLLKMLASTGETGTIDNVLSNVSGDMKVVVSLNKNDYSLSKITLDLLSLLKANSVAGIEYTKASYEMTFSEYGKVGKIEIPEEVINNAVELTEEQLAQ